MSSGMNAYTALSSATPAPGRVGQRHVALAVHVDQPRHAEEAAAAEGERIEEVVVDPAVDHVDLLLAVRAAHEDVVALDEEVAPLDERHAHLAGQERVLEVGRVVDARAQHDHHRALARPRRGVDQAVEEQARVVLDRPHRVRGEELREHAVQERAVLEDVGDAARAAAVVLEDDVRAVLAADEVGADDVGEDLPRRHHAEQLALVLLAREDELRRDDAVGETALVVVHVLEEQVERGDPLDEAVLDRLPLGGGDDARHEVEREDALEPLFFAVHGEGDALVQEREPLQALAALDVLSRERLEDGDERRVVRPGAALGFEQLVVAAGRRPPVHGP